jgi:hypothetical protein
MLENLEPAKVIKAPKDFRPGVVFDGSEGTATTEGMAEQPNFDDFLRERGYPPEEYIIVGTPRTSQWQQREGGEYLTSYRFSFRKIALNVDLPALFASARKTKPPVIKVKAKEKALIICPADFQVGKAGGSRGGTPELIARVFESFDKIELQMKQGWERIYILDMGDIIESFSSKAQLWTATEQRPKPNATDRPSSLTDVRANQTRSQVRSRHLRISSF